MKGSAEGVLRRMTRSSEPSEPMAVKWESGPSKLSRRTGEVNRTVVTPKCARCKNHGMICPLKGHKGLCKWKNCTCPNCSLIVERQKIMAAEQSVLKEIAEQSHGERRSNMPGFYAYSPSITPRNEPITNFKVDMTGVKEYICLHFGSEEARTTMAELEEWCGKDPQPCYIKILRRLFPDIKPKVLQLLLAGCDGDLIKTVETILPCCKKTHSNGHVTYIKASAPPAQKMMMLSRTHKLPTRLHDKRGEVLRYAPYPIDRTHGRCPTFPALCMPPYAHAPVAPGDNCGLCVPGYLPPYFLPRPRIARDLRNNFPYYTTPNFAECKTVTSSVAGEKDDNRTSVAATLISLSKS